MFPWNITNPGFFISGIPTSQEATVLTNLTNIPYVTGDILFYNGTNLTRRAIGTVGQVLTVTGGLPVWAAPSGGGGGHTIQDEGVSSTQRTKLNFVGAGVVVTDDVGNDASVVTITSGGGSGDVVGPASAIDNAVARFDLATGKLIQNSGVTISDTNGIFTTVAVAGNTVGLNVTQNDTTNNPVGINVLSASLGDDKHGILSALSGAVSSNFQGAVTGTLNSSATNGFSIYGVHSGTGGSAGRFWSTGTGAKGLDVLVDNIVNGSNASQIQNLGSGNGLFINQDGNGRGLYVDRDVTNIGSSIAAIQIDHTSIVTDTLTYIKSSPAIQINSNVIETSGIITDTHQVIDINQTHSDSTGNVVDISSNGTGKLLRLDATGIINQPITHITSSGLFAGASGDNASVILLQQTNASAPFTNLKVTQSGPAFIFNLEQSGNHDAIRLFSAISTNFGKGIYIDQNNNGNAINIDHDGNSAASITGLKVNVFNAGGGPAYSAIFEDGNVGIGTITPTEKLEITGNSKVSGSSQSNNVGLGKNPNAGIRLEMLTNATFIQGLRVEADNTSRFAFSGFVTGDSDVRITQNVAGLFQWGSGSAPGDTNLYRDTVASLRTDNKFTAFGGLKIQNVSTIGHVFTATDTIGNGAWQASAAGGVVAPVASRIYRNTNQSIPTGAGYTDLSWSTSAYQANGTFWTSGATTTIPENGYFQIFAEATFDGTGLLTIATADMQVLLNGATVIGDDQVQVIINGKGALQVMAQRSFTAGDTIKVQVKHSDAGSLNVLAQGDHSPDIIITKLTGAKGDSFARVKIITSGNVTALSAVSTDYEYFIAGAHILTLPTAISNTNQYTIKNNHTGNITLATTLSQTIDGVTSPVIVPEQAIQITSNGTNWNII